MACILIIPRYQHTYDYEYDKNRDGWSPCLIRGKKALFRTDSFGSTLPAVTERFLPTEWGGDPKAAVGRGRERDKTESWDWNASSWVDRWSGGGVAPARPCFVHLAAGTRCNRICIWLRHPGFALVESLLPCFPSDCSYPEAVVPCISTGSCRWHGVLKSRARLKSWTLRSLSGCVDP